MGGMIKEKYEAQPELVVEPPFVDKRPWPKLEPDPFVLSHLQAVLQRIDILASQVAGLAAGRAFIGAQERPQAGQDAVQASTEPLNLLQERIENLERTVSELGG